MLTVEHTEHFHGTTLGHLDISTPLLCQTFFEWYFKRPLMQNLENNNGVERNHRFVWYEFECIPPFCMGVILSKQIKPKKKLPSPSFSSHHLEGPTVSTI